MGDPAVLVLALATMAGAWVAHPAPLVAVGVAGAVALVLRRPVLFVVATAALASGLAAKSWAGLAPPPPVAVNGPATLLTDPVTVNGALRVELRLGHRHVEAWARGAAEGALFDRMAGEVVDVTGSLRAVPANLRLRLAPRHVSAQLSVRSAAWRSAGSWPARAANRLRRILGDGASSMSHEERALFMGFVLGDARGQSAATTDTFRAAGLTHLLVVSGENVAFVLLLASPLLRRLSLRARLVAGVSVLAGFGVLTRWEPSVLRAIAMATIAMSAVALGRPVSQVRLLALAVTALVLVDPLLVHAVGFLLSVGACAGIAFLAEPVARRLPGPRVLAAAAGVTIAAQIGVAPVLIPVFGGVPLAALPANLLAVPAAGPVMTWGMTAGVVAGVARGPVAAALHLPTRLLIGWIGGVARVAAALPIGQVTVTGALVIAAALLVVWIVGVAAALRSQRAPAPRRNGP